MHKVIKISVLATLMLLTGTLGVTAQTKEFKKEWNKLYDYVYFKSANIDNKTKMPSGETEIRIFGFKNKQEYAANIDISGYVSDARKTSKGYQLSFDKAVFTYEDDNIGVEYTGSMTLFVTDNILKDCVTMQIQPIEGNWGVRDIKKNTPYTYYHLLPEWRGEIGQLAVHVSKPLKDNPCPLFTIDEMDFLLPTHEEKRTDFTREISGLLGENKLPLTRKDSIFVHSVYVPGSRIEDVPELKYVESVMHMKNDRERVFGKELLYYELGNKLVMSDGEITLTDNGDTIKIIYHGGEPRYMFTATYSNSAFPKFTNVKWDDNKATFSNDVLTRTDGSKITAIKFEVTDNLLDMPQGFIINQAKALGDFRSQDFYDFNKYTSKGNGKNIGELTVGSYISPKEQGETTVSIEDGYIHPVKDRVEAERKEVMAEYDNQKAVYEQAQASHSSRQKQLEEEYGKYSVPKEVFKLPNTQGQALEPYDVTIKRQIKSSVNAGRTEYEELFFVIDNTGSTYPLEFDEYGYAFYTIDGRTYGLTRISAEAASYLDPYREDLKNKAIIAKGAPKEPVFD